MQNQPYQTIDQYIAAQVPEMQPKLQEIRQIIKKTVPEAQEVISYQMPAFKYEGMLMYFAAFKNHYSLFISPVVLQHFKADLAAYKTAKAAIQIPLKETVPVSLIEQLARYIAEQNRQKAALKNQKNKNKIKR